MLGTHCRSAACGSCTGDKRQDLDGDGERVLRLVIPFVNGTLEEVERSKFTAGQSRYLTSNGGPVLL